MESSRLTGITVPAATMFAAGTGAGAGGVLVVPGYDL
jgi:hypothetical protein